MTCERLYRSCSHIAGDTNLQRNLFFAQTAQEIGVVDGADTVSDPFRPDIQRRADGSGTVGFSRMSGEPQPGVFSVAVRLAEIRGGTAQFIAAYAE